MQEYTDASKNTKPNATNKRLALASQASFHLFLLYAEGCGGWARLLEVLEVVEVLGSGDDGADTTENLVEQYFHKYFSQTFS